MNSIDSLGQRLLEGRDPVSGLKLLVKRKSRLGCVPNPSIPVCISGEEHLVENYDLAKNDNFKGWVCHHRLELTTDGELANTSVDLVRKNMYFHRPHYELIWMKRCVHSRLHAKFHRISSEGRARIAASRWKGDKVSRSTLRQRRRRAIKRGVL